MRVWDMLWRRVWADDRDDEAAEMRAAQARFVARRAEDGWRKWKQELKERRARQGRYDALLLERMMSPIEFKLDPPSPAALSAFDAEMKRVGREMEDITGVSDALSGRGNGVYDRGYVLTYPAPHIAAVDPHTRQMADYLAAVGYEVTE